MANTYYFSTSGSTGNTGLARNQSWPLSKWTTINATLGADDQVLFKKGDNFGSAQLTLSSSGTAGHRIIIDCYGTGVHNPILDGGSGSSPVLTISGNFVTVNNIYAKNSTASNGIIYIPSAKHDITIFNVAVNNGIRGFSAIGAGANLVFDTCWGTNINDDSTHTHGGGSPIQLQNCSGAGIELVNCKFYADMSLSAAARIGIGDIISIYQCDGTSSSSLLVHGCQVRGGSSYGPGEAGMVLGDVGGSWQYGHDNYFCSPGAVGCQVQAGTNINMSSNYLYSPSYSYTFNGLAFANYSGVPCNNITMGNNHMNWRNGNGGGGAIQNYFIDRSGNSTSTGVSGGAALPDPTGWSTNTAISTADPLAFDAMIADPLYNEYDWDTPTFALAFSAIPTHTVGDSDFNPGATSSDPITYTSGTTATATIVSGNIHIVAAGTSVITADDGNGSPINQTLTVNASGSNITIRRKWIPI